MTELATRVRSFVHDTSDFFGRRIWERRLDEMPAREARWYRAARITERTLRSLLVDDKLHVRAAALTYFTVLSLVPLLAFVFALLKGFGAYDLLVEQTIRPYVVDLLSGNQALQSAFEQILGFVDRTGVTSLGFIGLLTLFYAATRLLRNIEGALNELWHVGTGRSPVNQLRDYTAIIVVTPLCLMAAAGLTTAGQAAALIRSAGDTLGITGLIAPAISLLAPLFILVIGLAVLYKMMPCTNVQPRSAVVGAIIGAVAWYGVLIMHVRFQVGVARFNALYSSFAALPIFLAWLQVSWLMVLIGAQVAAIHQNNRSLAQDARSAHSDPMHREAAALAVALRVARNFASSRPAPSQEQLCNELDLPESVLAPVLRRLVGAGLIVELAGEGSPCFAPARPLESVYVKDVLDALRLPQSSERPPLLRNVEEALALWKELDRGASETSANQTLAQLVEPQRS